MSLLFTFDLDVLDQEYSPKEDMEELPIAVEDALTKAEDEVKSRFPACLVCPDETKDYLCKKDRDNHFKLDYHNLNIKRTKMQSKSAITREEWDNGDFDNESIDGSDSDDDDGESINQSKSSPFANFYIKSTNSNARVYKNIFLSTNKFRLQRLKDITGTTCAILAVGAGHFAGAVFKCEPPAGKGQPEVVAIVHKTFHRYTTRRKQGGSQSANDNKGGGMANSAGAQIRRYNELALEQEIRDLLIRWKDHLAKCDLVFTRINPSQRRLFFFDPNILDAKSFRIKTIPFATRRPTYAELERIFRELYSIRIVAVAPLSKPQQKLEKKIKTLSVSKQDPSPAATIGSEFTNPNDTIPGLSPALSEAIAAIKSKSMDTLISVFSRHEEEDFTRRIRDADGISLLHVASSSCAAKIVPVLLSRRHDPRLAALTIGGNTRAYHYAGDKATRDAFRMWRGDNPDYWEYGDTGIPEGVTRQVLEAREEKAAEKKKRQREREKERKREKKEKERVEAERIQREADEEKARRGKKVLLGLSKTEKAGSGMSAEARMRLDREKRAIAAESRMRNNQQKCAACNDPLAGLTPFTKFNFKHVTFDNTHISRYCSMECLHAQIDVHTLS